ncbi:MAG: histidinol-phosphate aminotransferase [Saprospiraceae bacterium]|nr:MAG: histidinol-phosphate aminotransferase [Saprospiraceae bacterium]
MSTLNRRQWLHRVGWGSALSLIGSNIGLRANASMIATPQAASLTGSPAPLCFNENPFGPSQQVRQAITSAYDDCCRYPFQFIKPLVQMIADREGVTSDQVVITGGSTEGLKMTGLVYGMERGEVVAPDPTFQALLSYAESMGSYIHRVQLDADLNHDLEAMEARITGATRLIFVCNPNNPTGVMIDRKTLRDFTLAVDNRAVVFIDEAYIDYVTDPQHKSAVELVKEGHNVIVSRTFSKVYGLAGLRIGYLIARPDIAKRLLQYQMVSVSVPAIRAAQVALNETDFYADSLRRNLEAKNYVYKLFKTLDLQYVPSHTNFVFFKTGRDISELNQQMLAEGVRVGRPFPPLTDWCRVSTGRMEDMKLFAKALRKVLG